jgi:hypothetical protein
MRPRCGTPSKPVMRVRFRSPAPTRIPSSRPLSAGNAPRSGSLAPAACPLRTDQGGSAALRRDGVARARSSLKLRARARQLRCCIPIDQGGSSPPPDSPASAGTRRGRYASPGGDGLRPLPTEPGRESPVPQLSGIGALLAWFDTLLQCGLRTKRVPLGFRMRLASSTDPSGDPDPSRSRLGDAAMARDWERSRLLGAVRPVRPRRRRDARPQSPEPTGHCI